MTKPKASLFEHIKVTLLLLTVVFLTVNALSSPLQATFQQYQIQTSVVLWGNVLLFVLSIGAALLHGVGMRSTDPYVFYRMVMLATMQKLFISAIAVVLYIVAVGKAKNAPGIYVGMGLYLVYTTIEVVGALRLSNKRQQA
ncbi:MAG TPA: hypothetical protein DCL43_10705 [Chitinophagaceae bacterium]|nr:hypothetical protein [Chitinophagaceae bacterium]HAN37989.1 hypothetical protein [Chitinophagaceae bacterium]